MSKGFAPRVRSRHPSHNALRGTLQRMPFRSVVRFGSTTEIIDSGVELNTTNAIRNSSSKVRMKNCFVENNVKTAQYSTLSELKTKEAILSWSRERYPVVMKSEFGSRGRGNTLIKNQAALESWLKGREIGNYIVEKFHNYNREYRLHVSEDGCFYTCRKMLKSDTPESDRWFRNDSNCTWILEDNELFDRPVNWKDIETECVKALNACGLDFGACDVRVQSSKDEKGNTRKSPDFIIVEINSAPSFGRITVERYRQIIPTILMKKHKKSK